MGAYSIGQPDDKEKISGLQHTIYDYREFLEWLFDHSEHCDHISQRKAWKEFEEWELKNEV